MTPRFRWTSDGSKWLLEWSDRDGSEGASVFEQNVDPRRLQGKPLKWFCPSCGIWVETSRRGGYPERSSTTASTPVFLPPTCPTHGNALSISGFDRRGSWCSIFSSPQEAVAFKVSLGADIFSQREFTTQVLLSVQ